MWYAIFFLAGFVVSVIILAILLEKGDERQKKLGKEQKIRWAIEEGRKRRKEKIDVSLANMKTIKLNPPEKPQDAYYNNEEAFIAFHLEDMHPPDPKQDTVFPALTPFDDYKMFEFNLDKYDLPVGYEHDFVNALNKGKLIAYSKVEGKLVDEIKRLDRGGHLADKPDIPQFYDYYLPDGTLFFTIMNFHVCLGNWQEHSRPQKIKGWFRKFLP